MNVQINDLATPRLNALLGKLTDRTPLMNTLGKAVETQLRDHFLAKNSEPNKRGWPKQNFWGRIRTATAFTGADDNTATVTISDPAFLDKVRPAGTYTKSAGCYAIPLRREAAGVTPRSGLIPDLFVLRIRGKAFLAKRERQNWKGKDDAGRARATRGQVAEPKAVRLTIYYILAKTRKHAPDATALPPMANVMNALTAKVQSYLGGNGGAQ